LPKASKFKRSRWINASKAPRSVTSGRFVAPPVIVPEEEEESDEDEDYDFEDTVFVEADEEEDDIDEEILPVEEEVEEPAEEIQLKLETRWVLQIL
jgi:hypothetical protein